MSQPAANNSGLTAASDGDNRDPSLEAVKVIEQARAVLDALQAHADETGRILGEITRIGRTFDAVANHLLDSTFKATDEATRGVPSREAVVKLVEELGQLARVSLGASGDARRELQNRNAGHQDSVAIIRAADAALEDLAAALTRLASRPVRARSLHAIEIETLEPAAAKPVRRPQGSSSDLERALAATAFVSHFGKTGGYKN
jgi:hypothetical protein